MRGRRSAFSAAWLSAKMTSPFFACATQDSVLLITDSSAISMACALQHIQSLYYRRPPGCGPHSLRIPTDHNLHLLVGHPNLDSLMYNLANSGRELECRSIIGLTKVFAFSSLHTTMGFDPGQRARGRRGEPDQDYELATATTPKSLSTLPSSADMPHF